jgi:hypothetical protein
VLAAGRRRRASRLVLPGSMRLGVFSNSCFKVLEHPWVALNLSPRPVQKLSRLAAVPACTLPDAVVGSGGYLPRPIWSMQTARAKMRASFCYSAISVPYVSRTRNQRFDTSATVSPFRLAQYWMRSTSLHVMSSSSWESTRRSKRHSAHWVPGDGQLPASRASASRRLCTFSLANTDFRWS